MLLRAPDQALDGPLAGCVAAFTRRVQGRRAGVDECAILRQLCARDQDRFRALSALLAHAVPRAEM